MQFKTFRLGNYLSGSEKFFYVRKTLDDRPLEVLHDHDHHELFWIVSGRGHHQVNAHRYPLSAGDLVFIRPTDRHGFINDTESPLTLSNVTVPSSSVKFLAERYQEFNGRFFWTSTTLPFHLKLTRAQVAQLQPLETSLRDGNRGLARIEGFLTELCSGVLAKAESSTGPRAPGWLSQAMQQIEKPEHFRMGANGLVMLCGRGHEHVCRSVKRHYGATPSALINKIRMNYAAQQLIHSNQSIADVAQFIGLDNLSHFYREFKRIYDVTPAKYRQQYQFDPVRPKLEP